MMARTGKALCIIGMALLITSVLPSGFITSGDIISSGQYECLLVKGAGDIFIDIRGADNRNVSMYVLNYDDAMDFIKSGSLANCTPLYSFENVSSYVGLVHISVPGWYAVAVTASTEFPNMRYDITVTRNRPYLVVLLLGVTTLFLALLLQLRGLAVLRPRHLGKDTNGVSSPSSSGMANEKPQRH